MARTKRLCKHARMLFPSNIARHATQNDGRCDQVPRQVPRLPRETTVDVVKCRACHAKRGWMSWSATPATQSEDGCRQVPRLPRRVKVDVAKRHACHAKCCGVTANKRPRKRRPSGQARHQTRSVTPATQNEGGCGQVPRLPSKVARRRPSGAQARHRSQPGAVSATPATPSATLDRQSVAASPHDQRRPSGAQARHQSQPSAKSATPATQNGGGCCEVPRLPKMACGRWCVTKVCVKDGV